MLGSEEIANRFGFHKATEKTAPQHRQVRARFTTLAAELDTLLPDGRAKSMAMTELDAAAMWANKAVAEQAPVISE